MIGYSNVPAEATNLPQGETAANELFTWCVSMLANTSPEHREQTEMYV